MQSFILYETSHPQPSYQTSCPMDALKKPLRIPPEFSSYAEEREIFPLLERLLQEVLVTQPEDPLQFMANYLTREKDDGG